MRSLLVSSLLVRYSLLWVALCPAVAAAEQGPHADDAPAVGKWIRARAQLAKSGKRELVRVPLVRHSEGWGCSCPDYYLGLSPDSYGGEAYIAPEFDAGAQARLSEITSHAADHGYVVIAEGYFTGASTKVKNADDPRKYDTLWTLKVQRVRRSHEINQQPSSPDDFVQVVLSGSEAKKEVPPLADGRAWLVVAQDLPLFEAASLATADATRAKLVAAGYTQAEVLDGRQAPLLFCCFRIVVAGRYASKQEAIAAADAAKKKNLKVYVRQGF